MPERTNTIWIVNGQYLYSIEDIRYSTVQGKSPSPIDAAAVQFMGGKQGDAL